MKKLFQGIGINVILLGIVSLLNDISSEMIFAVLPFFIATIGGAGVAIGLIGGASDSIASILKVFSGYWSDRYGKRKPFVFSGYLVSVVSKFFFPVSTAWHHLLFLISIERTGKGIRTAPRDAIIAKSSEEDRRGKGFGIHRAMDTSGAVIGVLLAFFLYLFLDFGLKFIIFAGAIIGFFSLLPLAFVREKEGEKKIESLSLSLKILPDSFKFFLIIATIFALGNFTYMFYVLKSWIFFEGLFMQKMAIAIPIFLYAWFNIVYACLSIPGGILYDKIGRKKTLLIGYSLYAFTCLSFAFSSSSIAFFILFALYGGCYALIEGNQRAYASDLVEEELRGTGLGTFHTSYGLATFVASGIGGILWDIDPRFPFIYGAGMATLSVFLFIFFYRRL
ncbi:MAG: MFS transporter [Candidatus Syntropharchaeia archaeon]